MDSMLMVNATEVRKNWSKNLDVASRTKPLFIKRTRDNFVLSDVKTLEAILAAYQFNVRLFREDDGSYTASLQELDIVENEATKDVALKAVKIAIYEYAVDFYNEFNLWSSASNRKAHVPYVLKALLCGSAESLELNVVA